MIGRKRYLEHLIGTYKGEKIYHISPIVEFEYIEVLGIYATDKHFYLCLHSDFREVSRWICSEIKLGTIYEMLDGITSVNDALCENGTLYVAEALHGDCFYDIETIAAQDIDPLFLTAPNTDIRSIMLPKGRILSNLLDYIWKETEPMLALRHQILEK